MYFNEREDTNIDNEFKASNKRKRLNKYKQKMTTIIPIAIGVIVLFLIILFFVTRTKYFLILEGSNEITIYEGTSYIDPGYKAYDNKQNRYDNEVTINGSVNTNEVGSYTIEYTFRNKKAVRKVNVVARSNNITIIHLRGAKTIYLNVGSTYNEPGYSAVDGIDGDLTNYVKINSNVDTSKKGNYRIVYIITNSSGITTTETRIIVVE